MSDPSTYITVNVYADTPMDLQVGTHTALLTFGANGPVTLEFQTVDALEQLQREITTSLGSQRGRRPAGAVESTGDAR